VTPGSFGGIAEAIDAPIEPLLVVTGQEMERQLRIFVLDALNSGALATRRDSWLIHPTPLK
jgi:hypothetical protein